MERPTPTKLTLLPSGRVIEVEENGTLLELLTREGINIPASCGGKGRCGKCKVRLLKGHNPSTISSAESRFLTDKEIEHGYRLACQFFIVEDSTVVLPDSSDNRAIIVMDYPNQITRVVSPSVTKQSFSLSVPNIHDQSSDIERLLSGIKGNGMCMRRLHLLRKIPSFFRQGGFAGQAVLYENEVIDIRDQNDPTPLLGIAIDLGTTTIAMYLLDLETGALLAARSTLNSQSSYGQDVISRIEYAASSSEGLQRLRGVLMSSLSKLAEELCTKVGVSNEHVYDVSVVGNTTMCHIFLGINPESIATSPFVPVTTEEMVLEPGEACMQKTFKNAKIYMMPNISAYIGSDIVAGILASGLDDERGNTLLVDMGTNGEIVLKTDKQILACSAAAGPAFEGGHISEGMIAQHGAVDQVWIDKAGNIAFSTVDNSAPAGICGSGLVDAVAVMLDKKAIDETGRLSNAPFVLRNNLGEVFITQKDIRELQLAKSAIRAGIEVLLSEAGIVVEDVDRIFLAGAFGNYVKAQSAVRTGLLPDIPLDKILPTGNAAGAGAALSVINREVKIKARTLPERIRTIELSGRKDFSDYFVEFMAFPEEVTS